MPLPKRNSATVAKIRLLRALGPVRATRRVLPRQQQPDGIRLAYYRDIVALLKPSLEHFRRAGASLVGLLQQEREQQVFLAALRADAANGRRAKDLVRDAGKAFEVRFGSDGIADAAKRVGKRTKDWNAQQLDRQVKTGLAVPLAAVERTARDPIPKFVDENVALVKSVGERYHERLEKIVEDAFESGMRPETLAKRIQEIDEISDSDAMRIARDQIGKLNAEFNQVRQESLGVESYVWRTMNDGRERDEHADRDGEVFTWDNAPDGGHPGIDINCRCFAEPNFAGIVEDL